MSGDAIKNIQACIACHGQKLTGVLAAIPSPVGLPRAYLNSQFGAWKAGSRQAAAPDCMAQITRQLTPEDIGAVSAWLSSQPVPDHMPPAPALSMLAAAMLLQRRAHSGQRPCSDNFPSLMRLPV